MARHQLNSGSIFNTPESRETFILAVDHNNSTIIDIVHQSIEQYNTSTTELDTEYLHRLLMQCPLPLKSPAYRFFGCHHTWILYFLKPSVLIFIELIILSNVFRSIPTVIRFKIAQHYYYSIESTSLLWKN